MMEAEPRRPLSVRQRRSLHLTADEEDYMMKDSTRVQISATQQLEAPSKVTLRESQEFLVQHLERCVHEGRRDV